MSGIEIRVAGQDRSMFKSALGTALSCLGSAVGTGNIWRFPRILASQSYSKGSLTFYVAWMLLLFFWSIPLILVEYAVGRFTQNSPLPAFCKFMGKYFVWVGGWLTAAVFLISAYYPVIIGWCLYYLFISCTASELPGSEEAGMALFTGFTRDSYWPVFCQILAVALTGAFSFGGIHLVEKANMILVPLLLLILVFTFGWSMTREYAEVGIQFLFTPTWSSFAQPDLWIAAAGQNAFDTGAGMSVLLVYATYMDRSVGIVRYSVLIPVINNIVSLYASFTIFSTVFSTLIQTDGTITRSAILKIMQDSGPGSTGLTFTWIPVLFSRVGILGRVLSVLFFLCLTFAGVSSLLATLQACVLVLKEIGVSHRISVAASLIALVACGIPSALRLEILKNQDNTWGNALVISGLLLAVLVISYNPMRFRRIIINEYGTDDWPAPIFWIPIIT
ncbi:Sodium-and chloride-dependent GABA transporter ine [Paragonimus heterotremus]|uniref:Sodium-and chloride-dependent GABA transporter ine n=1 Tax=Paragonimus heterotremus TaxID=100268 RepID=A0A8J4SXG5_9TREM|nr:Sodium-and chloride-dependent GABA transporter ine [Paragonimus heterotremus]